MPWGVVYVKLEAADAQRAEIFGRGMARYYWLEWGENSSRWIQEFGAGTTHEDALLEARGDVLRSARTGGIARCRVRFELHEDAPTGS